MKRLLTGLLFAAMLLMVQAKAQNAIISGTITDKADSSALPFVTVQVFTENIPGTQATQTNAEGKFSITVVPGRKLRIVCSSVGYINKEMKFKNLPKMPLNVQLEKYPVIGGPPVITVYKQHEPVEVRSIRAQDNAPFSKTDLKAQDFEKINLGQDIPFLLNQTPSLVAYSDAGAGVGYTGLRIRGTDASRINMTINGIPYNDAESQGIFFVDLPDFTSSVSSLQIQRGVGSSTNGAGAFGGTLSFSTQERNDKAYLALNNSIGSFRTFKNTFKAGTGLLKDHFFADARLSSIQSDGFIDRARSNLKSYYLSTGYRGSRGSVTANIISGNEKTYQAWNGISEAQLKTNRRYNSSGTEKPGEPYDNEVDVFKQDHYQLLGDYRFSNYVTVNTTFFLTKGKGYYEQYKAGEPFGDYGLPDPIINGLPVTETDLVRQLWLDNNLYGQTIGFNYNRNSTSLIVGGAWTQYKGKHFGEVIWAELGIPKNHLWYNLNASKRDVNGFVKLRRQVSKAWYIFGDMQYRNVVYAINGFRNNPTLRIKENYGFVNPKAGVTWEGKKMQVALSYALANKEPNRDDFEANTNDLPRHETLHDVELNLKRVFSSKFQSQLTVYYMYYRNQLVLTGKINDVGAYARQNIPTSYRTGVEWQGLFKPNDKISLNGNLTLSRNKIKAFTEYIDDYDNGGQKSTLYNDRDISFSPSVIAGLTATVQPFTGGEFSLMNKYVGKQYLDNTQNGQRKLNDYYVADALFSYQPKVKALTSLRFLFQVNNLFDRKYEPNGYTFSYFYGGTTTTENYYFPMAGRNWMLGVNIRL